MPGRAVWEVYLDKQAAWVPFDPHTTTLLEQGHQDGETELQGVVVRGHSYTIQCGGPDLDSLAQRNESNGTERPVRRRVLDSEDATDDESPAVIECSICFSEAALVEASAECGHEALYCAKCLKAHIEAEVNSKGDLNVTCPAVGCDCQMEYGDVQRLASRDVFKTYDRLLLRGVLHSMPNFKFCKAVSAERS